MLSKSRTHTKPLNNYICFRPGIISNTDTGFIILVHPCEKREVYSDHGVRLSDRPFWNRWIDETYTDSLLHDAIVHLLFHFSIWRLTGFPDAKYWLHHLLTKGVVLPSSNPQLLWNHYMKFDVILTDYMLHDAIVHPLFCLFGFFFHLNAAITYI